MGQGLSYLTLILETDRLQCICNKVQTQIRPLTVCQSFPTFNSVKQTCLNFTVIMVFVINFNPNTGTDAVMLWASLPHHYKSNLVVTDRLEHIVQSQIRLLSVYHSVTAFYILCVSTNFKVIRYLQYLDR